MFDATLHAYTSNIVTIQKEVITETVKGSYCFMDLFNRV